MEKISDKIPLQLNATRAQLNAALQWRSGQILNASIAELLSDNSLTIKLAGRLVTVESEVKLPAGLAPGQGLQLKIVETGSQERIRLVSSVLSASTPSSGIKPLEVDAIRELLKQFPVAEMRPASPLPLRLEGHLAALEKALTSRHAPAGGEEMMATIKRLLSRTADSKQLTSPQQLAQLIKLSGLQFESTTRNNSLNPHLDIKGLLFKLADLIRGQLNQPSAIATHTYAHLGKPAPRNMQPPPAEKLPLMEMAREIDMELSNITRHQLQSLHQESQGQQQWAVNLPFFHQGTSHQLELLVREEPSDKNRKESSWQIQLGLELAPLGGFHAHLLLQAKRLTLTFYLENADSLEIARSSEDHLRRLMEMKGLKLEKLNWHIGRPPSATDDQASTGTTGGVYERI